MGNMLIMASIKDKQATYQAVGLAEALFSGTQQKVLGLLFGQPNRSYTLSELIQLANSGSCAVQRELERLAASDIDLLLVSDTLSLEGVFTRLAPLEQELGRPVNPTLYTEDEFRQRRTDGNPFLRKLLDGKHILLKGQVNGPTTPG